MGESKRETPLLDQDPVRKIPQGEVSKKTTVEDLESTDFVLGFTSGEFSLRGQAVAFGKKISFGIRISLGEIFFYGRHSVSSSRVCIGDKRC